jgi:hypothetical protein
MHFLELNESPGFIATPLTSTAQDEWQKPGGAIETKVPLKRIGQPEDIAQTIWFLCTPAGEYISGQGEICGGRAFDRLLIFIQHDPQTSSWTGAGPLRRKDK